MATKIENGDYCIDSHGVIMQCDYIESILQRAQILLKMKKGSFILNDKLGSELHTLDIHSCTNELLKVYISEALAPIKEIEFYDVKRDVNKKDDAISLNVYIRIADKKYILEV